MNLAATTLASQIKAGDQIRIRVEKDGYTSVDLKVSASPNVVMPIKMTPVPAVAKLVINNSPPRVVQVLRAMNSEGFVEFEIDLCQDHPVKLDIVRLTVEGQFFQPNICAALGERIYIYTFSDMIMVDNKQSGHIGSVLGEATSGDNPHYVYPVVGHVSLQECPSRIGSVSLTTDVAIPVHSEYATISVRFPAKFHITDGVVKVVSSQNFPGASGESVSDVDPHIPKEDFAEISASSFTNFKFTLTTAPPNERTISAVYPFAPPPM